MAKKEKVVTDEEEELSKSALKREMHSLQSLGEALLELNAKQRQRFPLSDELIDALDETKRITKREALRRHKQFIGKLMRQEPEIETIQSLFEELQNANSVNSQAFKALEKMREKLIKGDKTELGEVMDRYPNIDRQQLRHLTDKAQKEFRNNQANTTVTRSDANKALFRFLRESTLTADPDNY